MRLFSRSASGRGIGRKEASQRSKRCKLFRPILESLEERTVPAILANQIQALLSSSAATAALGAASGSAIGAALGMASPCIPPPGTTSSTISAASGALPPPPSSGTTPPPSETANLKGKVLICHHPDLGNGLHFIISVSVNALPAHLRQGDMLVIPDNQPITNPETEVHASDCQKQGTPRGTPFLNPEDIFTQSLFAEKLGRPASDQDVADFKAILNGLAGRLGVVQAIEFSPEARASLVNNFYLNFLGRAAVNGEDQGFINLLLNGGSEADVLTAILSSQEFAGNLSNEQFIRTLFNDLLNRAPGDVEVQNFMNLLAAAGRPAVVSTILNSAEFRSDAVVTLFTDLLGRTPSEQELEAFACSNMTLVQIRQTIESSEEAFTSAVSNTLGGSSAAIGAASGTLPVSVAEQPPGSETTPAAGETENLKGKVLICHHPDLGNGLHFIISVSVNALPAHLRQGDMLVIPDNQPITDPETQIHAADCLKQGTPRGTPFLDSDATFIQSLFVEKLGRSASDQEVASFEGVLNGPAGRMGVVQIIEQSAEAREQLVRGFYEQFLGREPQGGEEQGFVNMLLAGRSESEVLSDILASSEFAQDTGASDQEFVRSLYSLLLNRTASDAEVQAAVNVIASVGRAGLASAVLNSQEFRTDAVFAAYANLLGRNADQGGLNSFVSANLSLAQIRMAIEASDEFFTVSA